MVDGLREKSVPIQWWKKYQPFKLIFGSLPSVSQSERRWALYQVILSLVFFSVAIAFGILAIDVSQVNKIIMGISIFFFVVGLIGLIYAFGLGIYWYNLRRTVMNNIEVAKAKRDDRLHQDIQSLIIVIKKNNQEIKSLNNAIVKQNDIFHKND